MIDWIRKRIIIEKNAERQPKKKRRWREGGGGGARWYEGERRGKVVGGKEKASELLGIIYQYPSNPRIRMRRFGEGACSGVRGAGVRSIGGGGHEGVRGRSERVKNITPSHTSATSRMKRALTNTNNGRHKRMAGRCAKNRPTHSAPAPRCFGGIIAFHVPGGSSIQQRPTRRTGSFEGNFDAVMRRHDQRGSPVEKLTLVVPGLFLAR